MFNCDDSLKHYRKQSKIETAFSMIKDQVGESILAKIETAQANELLCKALRHNLCVLVQSSYELERVLVF